MNNAIFILQERGRILTKTYQSINLKAYSIGAQDMLPLSEQEIQYDYIHSVSSHGKY